MTARSGPGLQLGWLGVSVTAREEASRLSHILWLEECDADAAPPVGGKALGLGRLVRQGHRVPPGFTVTTTAYREALAASRLAPHIPELLAAATTAKPQLPALEQVRALFDRMAADAGLTDEITAAYRRLGGDADVYRTRLGIVAEGIGMGVVIQAMGR